ncbi:hypothetical protein RRF57_010047 [Xylaria bambusicola]|uniref:Heterokaryon incompatibility domain-containing protein n=1 Tax=Xylaria bambusicola TaxID=326684 RepID=A0AAN7URN1_9PEZI
MLKRLRVLNFFTAEQELRRLPDDLNATYARILSQLDDVLVDHAMVALQWLTTSARSLFVDELVEACAIKVGRIPLLDDPQNRLDEDDILEMLHDLVIVENLSGSTTVPRQRRKVILAHFSVHEFLIDREILIGSSKRLTITSKQSHQFLAKSCLSYLYYTRAQQRLDCPLREYAWYNWEHHISPRSDAKKQRIRRKAAKLYQLLVTRVPKLLDISHTLSSVNTPTSPEQDLALAVDWLPGDQLESLRVLQQTLAVMGGHPKTIIHNRRDSLSYHLFTPLGESRGDIRLISLTPCLDDCRDIEGDLYLVSLEDKPVYDALSYVWGDSSESEYILVNGTHYEVRGNLGGLLRRLRLRPEDESQFLWVDAICINQENREEKLHQIQRMPQIFRQAKEVVIGLGKEQPNDEKAINYMTLIAQGLREGEIGNSGGKSSISTLLNRIESDASGWSSIMELFNRQWWRKAWVTQEIVLAADATLLYGTMSLKFTVVEQLMRCLKALEILLEQTTGKTTSFQRLRDDWGWQAAFQICLTRHEYQSNHPIGLPQLLWRFKEKDCTYPADKIYSVLSMVTQPGDAIECDYSKPALKNFAEITINIISRYHCLDIFSICTFYRSYGRRNEQPSWVPDFTSQLPLGPPSSLVVPLSLGVFAGRASMSLFSAGGPGSSPKFTTSNARDTFTTIGRATDKILMCTRHSESVVDGVSLQRLLRINSLRTVLTTILGMESQSLWTAPNDERTVMEAFWKTILAEQWNEGELLSDSRLPAQLRIPPRTQSEYLALCKFETLSQHLRFIRGRQFILTQNGRLGLVPSWAMRDDTIVVMPGGAVPYVLRTVGQEWELIGEWLVDS